MTVKFQRGNFTIGMIINTHSLWCILCRIWNPENIIEMILSSMILKKLMKLYLFVAD